ncbi:MAG: hypothetical protein QOI08_2352, partial [Actinomycetota bacterium]|nr:hypothetical protein [Actinomycetota bacterium]
ATEKDQSTAGRHSPVSRKFVVAWHLVLGLFVVVLFAEAIGHGSWPGALIGVGVLVALGVVAWRWSTLAVTPTHDRLMVRQLFSTRAILKREIASFRTGGSRREAPGLAVRAVLENSETVVLGATGWYFRGPAEVESMCAALESWLRSAALTVR